MKKLYFDDPATKWDEAIPLGNGFVGAMVHGRIAKELIEMNEDSLWSGGPMERYNPLSIEYLDNIRKLLNEGKVEEAQQWTERSFFPLSPHSKHYQPLGQVWLQFQDVDEIQNYERGLDLENAVFKMEYNTKETKYIREALCSNPDQVFVYHIKSKDAAKLNFDLHVTRRDTRPGKTVSYLDQVEYDNQTLYLSGYSGNKETGIDYVMGVNVQIKDGEIANFGNRIAIENSTEATIYVVARTTFRSENPKSWCEKHLQKVIKRSYEDIKKAHIKDFNYHYKQMSLKFKSRQYDKKQTMKDRLSEVKKGLLYPDFVELYFNFGRYLLISSSREGSLPANLQGIWCNEFEPSWGSKYTININLEMNYWLCEKTGLSNLHLPVVDLMNVMLPRGKQIAKNVYGMNGACAHHVTDMWGDCAPMDYNISATVWPLGFIWLSLHIMEHYQYTKDLDFLKSSYPILEENLKFLLDYMFIDKTGHYATGPSVSPENTYITDNDEKATVCLSPTTDIQIVREFLTNYLEIVKDLKDETYLTVIKERLSLLPEEKIGKYGQLQEWQEDYEEEEPGHRHIAHLFGLHPGNQINIYDTPELAKASKVTLKRRLQNGGGHTGWSCAWIIHFYARLHEPEKGYEVLKKLFSESTLDNLLDSHPPFQIDGNFGGANAILEFIVQDYGTRVAILPSLPKDLNEGQLKRLRLKCGGELSLQWKEGKVVELELKAIRDLEINIHINSEIIFIKVDKNDIYQYKED